ncbi:MAG: NADP-dependent oxidoreductase [Polyangiales bacterium]
MTANAQILLKARPDGVPTADCFQFATGKVREPVDGEVLVRNLYLSLDPAIRGWMDDKRSYLPPIALGSPVRSGVLSEVVESRLDGWNKGDLMQALGAWEDFSTIGEPQIHGRIEPVEGIPLQSMLSVLGGNGLTAYFGLLDIGQPKCGDTVVVSAAAGGVGSLVGQIAKIKGCIAIGITGSNEKNEWIVNELGFDSAINYKTGSVPEALKRLAPKGMHVYFDNVGGEILDAALGRLALGARVVLCGAISQINNTVRPVGPSNYLQLIANRGSMRGFVTLDFHDRYPEARKQLAHWIRNGELQYRDEVVEGLEHAPELFLRLFDGDHRGKLLIKLGDPSEREKGKQA